MTLAKVEPRALVNRPVERGLGSLRRAASTLRAITALVRPFVQAWANQRRWLALVWLALIVTGLGYCRARVTAHTYSLGVDGGYFASVAVFVREGQGLMTNVSLLHKGDLTFPAPTSIYPLWPLLLGYGARLFPLESLARWLVAALYVTGLLCCYGWGSRVYPRSIFPRLLPGFNGGHVLAIVLGLSVFFQATSEPYSEGLAYTIMFAGFWRSATLLQRPSWWSGVEMGLWLGLTLLARPQLAVAAAAGFCVLAYAVVFMRQRARYLLMLATYAASLVAVCAPWFLYTWSFAPGASIVDVLSFAAVRHSDVLSPLTVMKGSTSLLDLLKDRYEAFFVAFSWANRKRSYVLHYFTFQYAAPAAVAFAALGLLRIAWLRPRRIPNWVSDPANLPRIFALTYGLGAFLALHAMHTGSGFYFHRRHGLGSVVFFGLALVYLLTWRSTLTRLTGVAILVSGVWLGSSQLIEHTGDVMRRRPPPPSALVRWLRKELARDPELVVAIRQPQLIGYKIPEVGFHYFHEDSRAKDFVAMATRLGVDYVIIGKSRANWWRARSRGFERVGSKGGHEIYRPKPELRP